MANRSLAHVLVVIFNAGWYLIAIVLGLALCLILAGSAVTVQIGRDGAPSIVEANAGAQMTIPVSFTIEEATHDIAAPSLGISRARIENVRGTLKFPAQRGLFFIVNMLFVVCALGLALWVLGQLRALFRTLRDGRPFVPTNASRLRQLAYAVVLGEVLRAGIVFFNNYYAMTHFSATGLQFHARPDFSVLAVINGLIIFAIAEVFRTGTRLDEEQSLTI